MNNSNVQITFLWPFYGLVSALKNWRKPWAMNVFWVACIYLGAIQIYCPAGHTLGDGADGGRYALQLIEMHKGDLGLVKQIALNFTESNAMDYYQLILTWFVSLLTDNPHVLFACFAAVFGFFYSRNMWYVLNHISGPVNTTIAIFIGILFLTCPIWQINGVRMWTATHIFMFALLPYIWDGDSKKLYWLIAVPFVHFSFLYFVLLSLVLILLPNSFTSETKLVTRLLAGLLLLTLAFSSLQISAVTNLLEKFSPDSYQDRIDLYTRDSAFANMVESRLTVNWYVTAARDIYYWGANILLLVLAFSPNLDRKERKLLNYCLFISSIANLASQIPSGARFLTIAHLFTISLVIWHLCKAERPLFRNESKYCSQTLVITLIFSIRSGLDYYGISLLIGDYLTCLFWDNNVPIINFIK